MTHNSGKERERGKNALLISVHFLLIEFPNGKYLKSFGMARKYVKKIMDLPQEICVASGLLFRCRQLTAAWSSSNNISEEKQMLFAKQLAN